MIIGLIVIFALLPLFIYGTLTHILDPGESDHDRCLRNIARLERELFPHWFYEEPAGLAPAPNYTQIFRSDLDPKSKLARDMMARGMLYSGEWEAAKTEWMEDAQS